MSSTPSISPTRPYALSWILLLGLLTALGPLSIDMYLPALPSMATSFDVSVAAMSNSVPAYFLGLAVGQLFYGPISDRFGRKPPLYFGLSLFVLASIWCALSTELSSLLFARTLQALGGCVGVVVARSAIRDCLSPEQSAQAYAMLLMVMGVAPILAPMLGATLLLFASWQAVFWTLAAVGTLCVFLIHFRFTETLAVEKRRSLALGSVLRTYGQLLSDWRFMLPALAGAFLLGALFVYISACSGLLMGYFGVSETAFAWLFGFNALGFVVVSQLNARLVRRYGLFKVFASGALIQWIGGMSLMGLALTPWVSLPLVYVILFITIAAIGLTVPNSTAMALADQGQQAGMASALMGALQFGLGLLGGALLHALALSEVLGIGVMMALMISLGGLVLWRYRVRLNQAEIHV